ncbi:MAG: S8 family serine peptidase, partial [Trichodesmium sp. St2_bin6]|nr:S8 family serine peptidase [Trichodesmium sp. St2_bin6]
MKIIDIDTFNAHENFLLPKSNLGNLDLNIEDSEDRTLKTETDPLIGQDNNPVQEVDSLISGTSDRVNNIQTRAAKKRDKAGNSRGKAYKLGVLEDEEKFQEFVGKSDRKDFYKFKVKNKTDIDIELDGLSGNADLYLLNNRGKVIEKSTKGRKRAEDIERTLNPGTYYVRVQSKGRANANYNLSLDSELSDLAGNSLKRAHNLGVLKDDQKFQEFVGKSDRKDIYKFKVKDKTDVDIELGGLSGNADLYLLNNRGKVIEKSTKGGKRAEDIERTLNPGTYYVRVQSRNKRVNADYTLNFGTTSLPEYVPDEILVKLKSEPTVTQTQSMMTSYGALAIRNLVQPDPNINSPVERWQIFKLEPGSDVEKVQKLLNKDSRVEVAEVNHKVSIDFIPNDSSFGSLWGLNNTGSNGGISDADIDAPEAWDTQKGNKDVVVAVVDTGVDYNHPDLASNMWKNTGEIPGNFIDDDRNGHIDDVYGFDWVNEDGDPMDDQSHGTHVAGTIGAVGNNSRGVVGVSPDVSIMSLKFLNSSGSGTSQGAAQAIIYAADMGADIINASYGSSYSSDIERDAIDYASKKGVLFVAAAGNSSTNNDGFPNYPSNYNLSNVISVAATDNKDKLAYFSNYGRKTVDLGAPGVSILSTVPNNRYASKSGTSMAAPHVAGAAALVLAENPNLSVTELKKTLLDNTDSISSLQNKTATEGRLNVNKAIQAVKDPNDFITVKWPDGSNTLEAGKSYTITWNDNIDENVQLELYKGGSFSSTINSSTNSDGSYSWSIPTSITSGSDYKIKISSISDSGLYDYSDSNFTIEPEEFITVTAPNGGNSLEPGISYYLDWEDNIGENVKIELYKGGSFYSTIDRST